MLKNIFLIIFVLCVISCNKKQVEGFQISGTTDSYITGSTARLFRVENQKKNVIDSTILEKGAFAFKGKVTAPDIYYITIDNVLGAFPIILANETYDLEMVTDSLSSSKVIGSEVNSITEKYTNGGQFLRDKHKILGEEFENFRLKGNKEGMQTVKFTYDSLVIDKTKYDVSFIKKHLNTPLSALILERITMAKQIPVEETKALYNMLSKDMQNTRAAKYALEFIDKQDKKQ